MREPVFTRDDGTEFTASRARTYTRRYKRNRAKNGEAAPRAIEKKSKTRARARAAELIIIGKKSLIEPLTSSHPACCARLIPYLLLLLSKPRARAPRTVIPLCAFLRCVYTYIYANPRNGIGPRERRGRARSLYVNACPALRSRVALLVRLEIQPG